MAQTYTFGSISRGTMRVEDLIDTFSYELRKLAKASRRIREFVPLLKKCDKYSEDDAADLVKDLFDALGEFAPPYCYFDAHEGDGSDYGFWPSFDAIKDSDALKVSDLSEVPRGYSGEVFLTNDHGNLTLYNYARGRSREVWGIV